MGSMSDLPSSHHDHTGPACSDPSSLSFDYSNRWTLPLLFIHAALLPLAMRSRMRAKALSSHLGLSCMYLVLTWALVVCVALGTNSTNRVPPGMTAFDVRIIYAAWVVGFPTYLMGREFLARWCEGEEVCCGGIREWMEFQAGFWDLAMVGLGGFSLFVVGTWSAVGSHEINTDLGHWVPGLGFMAYSGLLLFFGGKRWRLGMELQRAEGWMWITWGGLFDFYFTLWVGANGWTYGEQHLYQALMYVWAGGLSVLMAGLKQKSGWPMAVLCLTMAAMMGNHSQSCGIISTMHLHTGVFFFFAGIMRFGNRIVEASFAMMMAAGTFFFSSNALAFWADRNFDHMSYVFAVMVLSGTWWGYMALVFKEVWLEELEAGANNNGQYSRVIASEDLVDKA